MLSLMSFIYQIFTEIRDTRLYWVTPALTCVVLAVIAYQDYGLFHQVAELWAVSIAFMIFWFCWHTNQFSHNRFLVLLASGYLAVGLLDFFHLAILQASTNKAAQFWVSARFVEALALAFSVILMSSRIDRLFSLLIALSVSGLLALLILNDSFPDFYVDGALTDLKVAAEFMVILLLLLASVLLWKDPGLRSIRLPMVLAIVVTMVSEICFTQYANPEDLPNIAGHLLKVFSFWIVFSVILVQNLDKPFLDSFSREARYRRYYDSSPVAIWTEDFTALYRELEELREQGVNEIGAYLDEFPAEVQRMSGLIKVVEVNAKAIELFKVDDREKFLSNIALSFSDSGLEEFRRELEAIWNRKSVFKTRTQFQDLQGKPLELLLTVPIPANLAEAEEVMVSMLDISKELLAEVETEKAYQLMSNAAVGTMNAISATIEKRDPYTAGHQQEVSQLAQEIAEFLGWDPFRIQGLRFAAAIHNIGNVYVPAEILNRPGRLSDPEKGIIRSHPEVGADILANTELPWPVSSMILQHHERLDGSGYPHGLRGTEILEESLVIGVADMVLAMTSHRPFRAALSHDEALEELSQHGVGWFGETICSACEAVCRERWGSGKATAEIESK